MTPAASTLPVPAAVPEFLAPRIENLRHTLLAGGREEALTLARILSEELAESHGPLHNYTLHALELVAFCAQLAGHPTMATEVSVYTAAAWQRVLEPKHRQIRRQARNGAASWLTITHAPDAVRTGTALLALLQSVYGKDHPSTPFVERRLNAITGSDREAAERALRASGPALMIKP
ncbi:hypothetical protein ADK41_00935 [Streptomyces caelestis]|uniref:Uncharacterized protein n=1 Tax=Streptomyces caelestis TaxID=36816 RepID=A0A0M9XB48_9ACTN|nr:MULTISPECIES: hypothetical protein [Streptomyces]KOT46783.1 hypothetical protein ADK41_00935 [Streptomyces caelestis]